jgi:mRNA-degrading endonuclease toxin of MazEF toxin-antitoxin module
VATLLVEVVLTEADGLPTNCAVNFDNLQTLPKSNIGERIARLTTQNTKVVSRPQQHFGVRLWRVGSWVADR